jgi:hypothetical protein
MNIPINFSGLADALSTFKQGKPFHHCIVDDFFDPQWAQLLATQFPDYDSPAWYVYKNALEDKKALNNWNMYPPETYSTFQGLNAPEFVQLLSDSLGLHLYADQGLHGGGWHIHGTGGNLNPHLDYSIHPKLGLERKLNIIIYLSPQLQPEHGGHLGLWTHDKQTGKPADLLSEIEPRFNRAVLFDTTQNSWHGMSQPLTQPDGIYRKSFAVYYLCEPDPDAPPRGRALYAPRPEQANDPEVEHLIALRADLLQSAQVYRQT